jgi:hypothetical protein
MEAIIASEQIKGIALSGSGTTASTSGVTGVGTGSGTGDSDSELSTMSSSRYSGLEEDWWKEKAPEAAKTPENIGASKATVTVMRTRSRGKRVHWE